MVKKRTILDRVTSEDISRQPDQAAWKINRLIDEVNRLIAEENE